MRNYAKFWYKINENRFRFLPLLKSFIICTSVTVLPGQRYVIKNSTQTSVKRKEKKFEQKMGVHNESIAK